MEKDLLTHLELQQRQELLELLRGYRRSCILITCTELGVFEAFDSGQASAQELASRLGTDPRGMTLLLDSAAALGLLEKRNGKYAHSPAAAACLAGSSPYSLANFIKREGAFYRRWGNLTQAVRTGQRPEENVQDEKPEEWARGFEYALYDLARPIAPLIADALKLPEDRPLRVLDVGGGHGCYSLALARRYPNLTATVFELPRVAPVTREIIAAEGLVERVTVQEGDFQQDDLGSGYDLALLFGVLPGESPQGRARLIKKAFAALKPGGWIVLREFLLDADRAGPPEAALFALQMLLSTDHGGASTAEELAGWLEEAGFTPPRSISLPAWAGTNLTVAKRP